jgi:hypothetical protein
MKKSILLLAVLLYQLPNKAQQVYKPSISPFSKIEIYGSFDVEIRKSDKESVKMESETIDLTKVRCKVKKNTLKIKLVRKLFNQEKQVKVLIEYKNIESILVSNGAALMSKEPLKISNLTIIEGNGSKIDFVLNNGSIIANIDKGAVLSLEGTCKNFDIEASSSAICNAYELVSDSATVRANAGGLVKINAVKYLNAAASTGGDVSYRGKPTTLKQKTALGGTIEKVVE